MARAARRGCPLVVVTHTEPAEVPAGGVYIFVTTGIEDALARARAAAKGKSVSVMGGPAVANQFLRAGLVDEVSIHLVPALFGAGTLLTDTLPAHIQLELAGQEATQHAMHLRYRVKRAARDATLPGGSNAFHGSGPRQPRVRGGRDARCGGAGGDERSTTRSSMKAGVMLAGDGLHPTAKGAKVRFEGRERTVIDGPFTEAKEIVAGYWIWECASREEALEWLRRAPFDGGMEIELRQIDEDDFGEQA